MYYLKRLPEAGLEGALDKADRYRDLNEPEEAESICRDVLDVRADHQRALRTLGLALTDRFSAGWTGVLDEALATFENLSSEYERVYYAGVAWERCGKAQLTAGQGRNALVSIEHAMELFERAQALAPADNPDPILRWNRCVRAITMHPLLLDVQDESRASHPGHFRD